MGLVQYDRTAAAHELAGVFGCGPRVIESGEPAFIAEVCRQVASTVTPCLRATLARRVRSLIAPLVDRDLALSEIISEQTDRLIAVRDLLEIDETVGAGSVDERALVLGPPSFVQMGGGRILLVGIAPRRMQALPESVGRRVEAHGDLRWLILHGDQRGAVAGAQLEPTVTQSLAQQGLLELSWERWVSAPEVRGASALI